VKKNGAWFVLDHGEWIPPGWIKPMIQEVQGPEFLLKPTQLEVAGWNTRVFLFGPPGAKKFAMIEGDVFPYTISDYDVWVARGNCTGESVLVLHLSTSTGKWDRSSLIPPGLRAIVDHGYVVLVRSRRTNAVIWCGSLATANLAPSHVFQTRVFAEAVAELTG
jgi:hypothetical protein